MSSLLRPRKLSSFPSLMLCIAGLILSTNCSADIVVDVVEGFDGVAVGTMTGGNDPLAGTSVRSINALDLEVVAAPTGFTTASGNVLAISSTDNAFGALGIFDPADTLANNNGFAFQLGSQTALSTDPYSLTFDLYIPSDLVEEVGRFQPRFGGGNNGIVSAQETGTAGLHQITVTGLVSDFIGSSVTTARPFVFFEQNGDVVENLAFIDNLTFTVGVAAVPEPSSVLLCGIASIGLVVRRRKR